MSELNNQSILSLEYTLTKNKAQYIWDDDVTGFGIRVYPSGKHSYVVRYRQRGRKRINVFSKVGGLAVEDARAKARDLLSQLEKTEEKVDVGYITSKPNALAFKELSFLYLKNASETNQIHWKEDQWLLYKNIYSVIGALDCSQIDRVQFESILDSSDSLGLVDLKQCIFRVLHFGTLEGIIKRVDALRMKGALSIIVDELGETKGANNTTTQNIVDAAISLCENNNYQGLNVAEITTEAGVSVGSFYRSFEDKESLLQHVFSGVFTSFIDELQSISKHVDEHDIMGRFTAVSRQLRFFVDYHMQNPGVFFLWTRFGYGISEKTDQQIENFKADVVNILGNMLRGSVFIDAPSVEVISSNIAGASIMMVEKLINGEFTDVDKAVWETTRFLFAGMLTYANDEVIDQWAMISKNMNK